MYTIGEVSALSGITLRTLRYYDQIGLLSPRREVENDYRLYGSNEIDRLQQILFYRKFGLKLVEIKAILDDKHFDVMKSLQSHREKLIIEQKRLNRLIATIDQSIHAKEENLRMKDTEKFKGFKEQLVAENEKEFGAEVRSKYGDDVAEKSNKKFSQMNEAEYSLLEELSAVVIGLLIQLVKQPSLLNEQLGNDVAYAHREWLELAWKDVTEYDEKKHINLAEMYLMDERFTAFYDEKAGSGATKLLVESLKMHL